MESCIICPGCGNRLTLFESQAKARRGFVRCTRCGQRIKYDLDARTPVRAGYWAAEEPAFKPGAQARFLSIAKAKQKSRTGASPVSPRVPAKTGPSGRVPPAFTRSAAAFQKFDMKTGTLIGNPGNVTGKN